MFSGKFPDFFIYQMHTFSNHTHTKSTGNKEQTSLLNFYSRTVTGHFLQLVV